MEEALRDQLRLDLKTTSFRFFPFVDERFYFADYVQPFIDHLQAMFKQPFTDHIHLVILDLMQMVIDQPTNC